MIRTGIYGGTFNPIHLGHTQLGKLLVDMGLIDELWLLVSPQNPFKVNQSMLSDDIRLHLTQLAVKNDKHINVCDAEFHLPRPSYMFNTLEVLQKKHPNREFLLIIGADNWERFPQWYKSKEIIQKHRLIVIPRPGYSIENTPPSAIIPSTPLYPISSTQIRDAIQKKNYNGEYLDAAVWDEIKEKGYYL